MTAIMMYMSGNSLQIFSIMMVFMAFKNPLVGLMNTNQAFERFQTESNASQVLQTKLVYVAMQILALALGVWKVNGMGLLPYVLGVFVPNAHVQTLTRKQDDTIRLADVGDSEGGAGAHCTNIIEEEINSIIDGMQFIIWCPKRRGYAN